MKEARLHGATAGGEKGFPCRLSISDGEIHIVAELGEIGEELIRIDLEGRALTISADGREPRYRMTIDLPWEAGLRRKRFRGGVLELVLGKPA